MLYEAAHFVKDKLGFLWNAVEWGNETIFTLQHKKGLKDVPEILRKVSSDTLTIRETKYSDVSALVTFFAEQPEDAYTFFKPHGFDEKSLKKVLRNKSFLTFVVTEGDLIVGYFFLRSFVNGKCFKGRMVDYRQRGKGIAKFMGIAINNIAMHLGMKIFTTISPENYASLASTKAVNDIRIVKTLENGYYYIECTPKNGGGENGYRLTVIEGRRRGYSYAA